MTSDYNMLVTFHENERGRAEEEVNKRLSDVGIALEDLVESSVQGLLLVRVTDDPKKAVRLLRGLALKYPEMFQYTHRYVPIERWVKATEDAMIKATQDMASEINEGEHWKMELQKRHWSGSSTQELIIRLTDNIDKGNVDLEEPDKIVMVEMIGDTVGFSTVSKDEMLDINKVREELGLVKIF